MPNDPLRPARLDPPAPDAADLVRAYARWFILYLLGMLLMWAVGIEAIYGHPTPFYALFAPPSPDLLAHLAGLLTVLAAGFALRLALWRSGLRASAWQYIRMALWTLAACLIVLGLLRPEGDIAPPARIATFFADYRWHLLAVAVFATGFSGWTFAARRLGWFEPAWSRRTTRLYLVGLFAFSIAFACAIAMLRGGADGIADAYARQTFEYIGDIGKTRTIQTLFRDYTAIHEHLSMHAKVHPPGPIALLWVLSYFTLSREPLALSIATVVFGSLAIFPLFYWLRDLTSEAVARTAATLYACIPGIVLFTATSADVLFMPFTLTTLFLFGRAIDRRSLRYAFGAGIGYGCMSLLSFSLLGLGAWFAVIGLWKLRDPEARGAVFRTAAVMVASFLALHGAVYMWSGFDVVESFRLSKAQFDLDQHMLDLHTPRYPAWTFRVFNPLCWAYFAGIPITILLVRRLYRPGADFRALALIFFAILVAIDLLYLARGEGERSAMYIYPFMLAPAAHLLHQYGERTRSLAPLAATLAFLAFQTWFTETLFYGYW